MREKLTALVEEGEILDMEEKILVIKHMHTSEIRNTMSSFFSRYATVPTCLQSPLALKTLAEITKYLLTACVHDRDKDYKIIYGILLASQNLFAHQENRKKTFLTALIRDHGIWQDLNKWRFWIYRVIERKAADMEKRRKRAAAEKNAGTLTPRGMLGFLGKKMLGVGSASTRKAEAEDEAKRKKLV